MEEKSSTGVAVKDATASPRYKFPKGQRLRSRAEFRELARFGAPRAGRYLMLQTLAKKEGPTQLGITVTRRFGKAHERNRLKRLIREAFRKAQHELPPSLLFNVRPRPYAKEVTLEQIHRELIYLLCGSSDS